MINAHQTKPKQIWKGKLTGEINQRGGDRESTWKRIQNNDSKNDPKSWKQNGVTDSLETMIENMQLMFNKELE